MNQFVDLCIHNNNFGIALEFSFPGTNHQIESFNISNEEYGMYSDFNFELCISINKSLESIMIYEYEPISINNSQESIDHLNICIRNQIETQYICLE